MLIRILLFTALPLCSLNAAEIFSVDWLRKGCAAIVVGDSDKRNFTKDQESSSLQTMCWLNGFLVGANSMCMMNEAREQNSKLTFPPEGDRFKEVSAATPQFS